MMGCIERLRNNHEPITIKEDGAEEVNNENIDQSSIKLSSDPDYNYLCSKEGFITDFLVRIHET